MQTTVGLHRIRMTATLAVVAVSVAFLLSMPVIDKGVSASGQNSADLTPPRLLVHVAGQQVTLAAMAHARCGPLEIVRKGSHEPVALTLKGDPLLASIVDAPGDGVWEYHLRLRPPGDGSKDDRPSLVVHRVDLSKRETLVFLGGTRLRGLFEHVSSKGIRTKFFVPVGMPIGAAVLDEHVGSEKDPAGELREVSTAYRLLDVRLIPALAGSAPEAVQLSGSNPKPESILGVDGKPMLMPRWPLRVGPGRLAAMVETTSGIRTLLAEGEELRTEPHE